MTSPPRISFLVPTFNGGAYLTPAIESIADQLIPGDEVLVQDGASTDGSITRLCELFADAPWLKVVSEPDEGQSDALDKALRRAVNNYVMGLNADDIVYPGALEAVRRGLSNQPDILCGRSTIFTNSGRVVRTYTPGPITREAFVGRGSNLFTGSLAFRTELVREVGGFDARYQYCMDIDLIARLSERRPAVTYIPEVIGGLRWHGESKGGSTLWPIVREATEVRLAHARTPRERVTAIGASMAYLMAGMAQPIRHSTPYSAIKARLSKHAAQTGGAP
ncbi:MAG: glycosyltransferase [Actinomycetota bacterium]|nr:glycosyltransferase [Actinomycetota bacterium]